MRRRPALPALLCAAALCCALLSCSSSGEEGSDEEVSRIRVASFDFDENRVLGALYAAALERAGFRVTRSLGLGPREVVAPALEQGHADLVPEYSGSALRYLGYASSTAPEAVRRDLDAALAERGLVALALAPGQDQNGVVVSQDSARRHGLRRISDLAAVAGDLSFGGPPECSERPLCLAGLRTRYGLAFREFVPFDSRAATAASLLAGSLDVGMLETVDAHLADGRLVLLEDDRRLQPPENVVPVLRQQVLDEHGDRLRRVLDAVSATLTRQALVELDRQVVLERAPVERVAERWLEQHGLG
jgi:osmoprotectant transport system substrate-binding protein